MSSSPEPAAAGFAFGQLTPVASAEPPMSMEHAARKARRLVAAAEAEADRIRSDARAAGHADGFAAGHAEALASAAPTLEAATAVLSQIRDLESCYADRVEAQAVELAVRVAERVVAGVVELEPARVLDVVRGALRTLISRDGVTVLVHPDDVALLREAMPDLDVHEERRVTRGGAIVRTSLGEVDAQLETKLDRARAALLEELGSS